MPVPPPLFEDHAGVTAVLVVIPYVPTPVDGLGDAICALRAHPHGDDEATLSQTQESLVREALDLVADRVAFESCVDEVKHYYWDNRATRERVQVAATCWLLDSLSTEHLEHWPGGQTMWVDCLMDVILARLDAFKELEECALRDAARARGFDLVIILMWTLLQVLPLRRQHWPLHVKPILHSR